MLDGVTPAQRTPLLPNLPTLYFCNSSHGAVSRVSSFSLKKQSRLLFLQEERSGKSYYNSYEINLTIEMIKSLINWGIKPHQIGIIALCTKHPPDTLFLTKCTTDKPQAYKIESALSTIKASDISAGKIVFYKSVLD